MALTLSSIGSPLTAEANGPSSTTIPRRLLGDVVRLTDFLAVLVAVSVLVSLPAVPAGFKLLAVAALSGLLTVALFGVLGLYTLPALMRVPPSMLRIASGVTAAFGVTLSGVVALGGFDQPTHQFSLDAFFAIVTVIAAVFTGRSIVSWRLGVLSHAGRLHQRTAVFGSGTVAQDVIRGLESSTDPLIRVAGTFDDRGDERGDLREAAVSETYPVLGGIEELIALSRANRFDLVILALPLSAEARLAELMSRLAVLPVDVKLPAQASSVRFAARTYSHIGPVAMIDLSGKPIGGWGLVAKSLFDKSVAAAALLLLAPVLAAVALAVRLESRGPVLFRQKRYGFNNELIEVLKFRSMHVAQCDAAAQKLVTRGDPRVTRVGRFIRKTSLDELPQLFNVLIGDLSLVGPRPHAVQAKAGVNLYKDVVEDYFARHKVKPGITGWAQINGWRGETDTDEKIIKRVEFDLHYIENWSLMFDIYILLKTPFSLLKTDNAY